MNGVGKGWFWCRSGDQYSSGKTIQINVTKDIYLIIVIQYGWRIFRNVGCIHAILVQVG